MVAQKEEYLTATMMMNLQKRVSSYRGSAMVVGAALQGGKLAWMRIYVRAEINLYHTRQMLDKTVYETYEIGRSDFENPLIF